MAFSFRKILSNINYFKKSDGNSDTIRDVHSQSPQNKSKGHQPVLVNFDRKHIDRSACQSTSLKLPNVSRTLGDKKVSLSDTDLLSISVKSTPPRREKRKKCTKLQLDITKAKSKAQSMIHLSDESLDNIENTPRHILLDCKNSDGFSERFKEFDLSKSFDLFDEMSDESLFAENVSTGSYSEYSDSDISIINDPPIKMCRRVSTNSQIDGADMQVISTPSPVSFEDIEMEKNDEESQKTILNYQMKLDEIEVLIKKLLNEFHFQIEISKTLKPKSTSLLSGNEIDKVYLKHMTSESRAGSPAESWNVITNKEEEFMKYKLKKQLWSIKNYIEQFMEDNLHNITKYKRCTIKNKRAPSNVQPKRMSYKKKIKHFDFPDIRDAMLHLFQEEDFLNVNLCDIDESDTLKFNCKCQGHSTEEQDAKEKSEQSFSISSSIGNFSLHTSALTAFSESLDETVSYNSFQETSLYNTFIQKPATERITFYVKIHSIEMTCEQNDSDLDSKNIIIFNCPPCKYTCSEENDLLQHILSQVHCEKIHFLYKTAYIKKCVATGKEIQPSTVLNPMTMYRDANKIVCFGDAEYACSLCFENLIIGESVLISHCWDPYHVAKRQKLNTIINEHKTGCIF